MCWCFPFGLSNPPKRRSTSSAEKKRRTHAAADSLHGDGVAVVAGAQEKRRSRDAPQKRRPRESVTPRPQRREREDHRLQQQYQQQYHDAYRNSAHYARPPLNVQVPNMWHRSVDPDSAASSQETLLNPRPHRSPHQRQAHPKRTSQTTLRGRGAKRDPPRHSKSKKSGRHESSRGWSLFAPSSPPKTPSRRDHQHYQTLDASPRGHRSQRHQPQPTHAPHQAPESSSHAQARQHQQQHQQQHHHHRSRQHQRQSSSSSSSRTPNTATRRVPDRRFAVLAATNQALEDLRREAFAQPSPPPRRERTQRYQGVAIPTSSIPFNWDCVSSSQASAGYVDGSARVRRHRR